MTDMVGSTKQRSHQAGRGDANGTQGRREAQLLACLPKRLPCVDLQNGKKADISLHKKKRKEKKMKYHVMSRGRKARKGR